MVLFCNYNHEFLFCSIFTDPFEMLTLPLMLEITFLHLYECFAAELSADCKDASQRSCYSCICCHGSESMKIMIVQAHQRSRNVGGFYNSFLSLDFGECNSLFRLLLPIDQCPRKAGLSRDRLMCLRRAFQPLVLVLIPRVRHPPCRGLLYDATLISYAKKYFLVFYNIIVCQF
ncbi:hypothetical protein Ddye_027917 [Dipteronia dyeriana]|uniref:Uncharacterized protein n=1 Tax=Dipteronia dyeriana TaxID=168575 RepID=A0AAD9TQH1_9ROSI|nr:hypothetical protein Ddye_027917 [Dipteronia dyeriana]